MFLIDDILMLPVRGLAGLFKKIHEKALEELEDTPEKLKRELLDLEIALETGKISKAEYEKKEKDILKRLEKLKK